MLRLEGFACGYGSMRAVHGLDIEVAAGSVFALIGANGAGKTSTIMAIAGHVEVQQGRIMFDDKDISRAPARGRIGLGIALVPEGRRLFPDLTVDENLIVGGYALPKARTGPNRDNVYALFPRLAERRGQRAGSLSGGEQQMLALGRARISRPKLLLLDEPSLGLAPKIVEDVGRLVREIVAEGVSVLLVEQNARLALELSTRGYILENGRIVHEGPSEKLREDKDVQEFYLGLGDAESSYRNVKLYRRRRRWLS